MEITFNHEEYPDVYPWHGWTKFVCWLEGTHLMAYCRLFEVLPGQREEVRAENENHLRLLIEREKLLPAIQQAIAQPVPPTRRKRK